MEPAVGNHHYKQQQQLFQPSYLGTLENGQQQWENGGGEIQMLNEIKENAKSPIIDFLRDILALPAVYGHICSFVGPREFRIHDPKTFTQMLNVAKSLPNHKEKSYLQISRALKSFEERKIEGLVMMRKVPNKRNQYKFYPENEMALGTSPQNQSAAVSTMVQLDENGVGLHPSLMSVHLRPANSLLNAPKCHQNAVQTPFGSHHNQTATFLNNSSMIKHDQQHSSMVGGLLDLDISKDSSQLSNTSTGSNGSHAAAADLNGQCSAPSFASIMASNGLGDGAGGIGTNTIGTLAAGMLPAGLNSSSSSAAFESATFPSYPSQFTYSSLAAGGGQSQPFDTAYCSALGHNYNDSSPYYYSATQQTAQSGNSLASVAVDSSFFSSEPVAAFGNNYSPSAALTNTVCGLSSFYPNFAEMLQQSSCSIPASAYPAAAAPAYPAVSTIQYTLSDT